MITESYAPPRFKVARSALTIAERIANPMFCAVVESLEVSRSPESGGCRSAYQCRVTRKVTDSLPI